MKNIIIFPTTFHLQYLEKNEEALPEDLCILYTGKKPALKRLPLLAEEAFDPAQIDSDTRLLACSEAALYFMWRHKCFEKTGQQSFSQKCYKLFVKSQLQQELQNAGIPHLKKTVLTAGNLPALSYPLIVKPNFGFGSQLVVQVPTADALRAHLEKFPQEYEQSIVEQFRIKYLGDLDEKQCKQPLSEDDRTDLCFASVPFIVQDNDIQAFYPTTGDGTLIPTYLTEHKVVFSYPVKKAIIDTRAIRSILDQLKDYFELTDGVYHSEFLCGPDETYLVEFSPRLTGEAISRMISYAEGIDLAGLSISLFLDSPLPYSSRRLEQQLELWRIYTQMPASLESQLPPVQKRLLTLSKERPESVSVDVICTV